MIAVQAHQRRQIKGGAQPGLPLFEQKTKAGVGFLRRAEPGELPHGPQPAAVQVRMNAAREGILAGVADIGDSYASDGSSGK